MKTKELMKICGLHEELFKSVGCSIDDRLLIVSRKYAHPIILAYFDCDFLIIEIYKEEFKDHIINYLNESNVKFLLCK